jgi:hypothetical protein
MANALYANLYSMLDLTEKPVADIGTTLRHVRKEMLDRREFEIAGLLWTAIDAREKMNVAIGEAMAMLEEKAKL